MVSNFNLKNWLIEALNHYGRKASIVQVCKYIWETHSKELEESGDIFYTWQYDVGWTAQQLVNKGKLKKVRIKNKSSWELID